MQQKFLKYLAVLFFLSFYYGGFSQDRIDKAKPKIGLVLSGGGAKGCAHIGVIKVLEEAGIKPDIITGTSMGSIVGGLYAAGYTSEELSFINQTIDWERMLNDDEPMQKVAIAEKSEINKYLFSMPIEGLSIDLPGGLIEGQHIENYLSGLFWPLSDSEDFNDLPIPFHCMSVDLVSGRTIEHQSGDLSQAIRASMSIPTVFSPVHKDSMLLVDGGVSRNFPVQEAIDMGADIIIGVYVGYERDIKAEELTSMTDILQRATALAGIVDARMQNPKCDILIVPDLEGHSAGDFSKTVLFEKLGEASARKHYDEIKALAQEYELVLRDIPKYKKAEKILISGIEVENIQYLDEKFVKSKSGFEIGDSVSYDDIQESIEYMYGTQYFKKLTYSLKKGLDAGFILVFHVMESSRAIVGFAPNYDDDLGVSLVANITLRNIILPSSRLLASMSFAENPSLHLSLNKKFGKRQSISNYNFLNAYSYHRPYHILGDAIGDYKRRYFDIGTGIHSALGLDRRIGFNAFYKYSMFQTSENYIDIFPDACPAPDKLNELGYLFFYELNSSDDLYFPKEGAKLNVFIENGYVPYSKIERKDFYGTFQVDYNMYKTFADKLTYNFGVGAGLRTDDPDMNGTFALGGSQYANRRNFINFAGYSFAEIYTQNYVYLKSALNIEVFSGLYLSGSVNIGNFAADNYNFHHNFVVNKFEDYFFGYNFGIKYDFLLGPIQFLISDNNKDRKTRFYLSIGFPF